MRVYELAKQLEMENRELIPALKRMGIAVTSHSSALDDDVVQKVLTKLSPKAKVPAKATGKAALAPAAPVVAEDAKADKRRILIKRKRDDEASAEDSASLPESEMTEMRPAGVDPLHVHAPSPVAAVHPPHPELTVMSDPMPSVGTATAPPPLSSTKPALAPSVDLTTGKKKALSLEEIQAEGLKKKARKSGRTREEEELRLREDAARWQDVRAIPLQQRRDDRSKHVHHAMPGEVTKPRRKGFKYAPGMTVKEFAELIGQRPADIMRKLMDMGLMLTFNQTMNVDAAMMIADENGIKLDLSTEKVGEELLESAVQTEEAAQLESRSPVVTIMGHVDHGKTSLLDAIRKTEVVAGEAGGITQHIGAYQVRHDGRLITFLDTPGHEAFTAMRARGAQVTDIAVIVVAADDGPKPQTDEAIDHARAAGVPIVVAVNKVDKEGADPTRVRTEMTERKLQPAEWGGETEYVDVSAKSGAGLDELLETLLVVAELEDLKANADAEASGIVVESKLDPGRGPVVTVLIQRGTLNVGDAFVAGGHWGKARALHDHTGAVRDSAFPGDPVELLGFDGVPDAGEVLRVTKNEKIARQQAEERQTRLRNEAAARRSGRKVSFEDLFSGIQQGVLKDLNLVLKADVSGSLEAFEDEIAKLPQDEISVNIIHRGVGGINESDVMLAAASDAIILGFNVRPVGDARGAADREGVEIRSYSVIYKALEELRDAMTGMLEPEEVEDALGSAEVRQTFKASKVGTIAGCQVTAGKLVRNAHVRVVRDGTVVYATTIDSLKRFNDDAKEVAEGFECGVVLANFQDVKEGDVLEAYTTRKVERKLS